jgi:hypothetical protein
MNPEEHRHMMAEYTRHVAEGLTDLEYLAWLDTLNQFGDTGNDACDQMSEHADRQKGRQGRPPLFGG